MIVAHSDKNRYWIGELFFFAIIFFIFPVVTDIEYRLNESPCANCDEPFLTGFIFRIVSVLFNIWPWLFFYQVILKKFLLKKRYLVFVVAVVLYLAAYELYIQGSYWLGSRLSFLPLYVSDSYKRFSKASPVLHYSVIYVLGQMLLFTALAYFIQSSKQQKQIHELKQAKLETDLNYLKAQLQPHFFFNTLNNIYSMALQQSKHTAPLVAKLSEMMRYVLYETAQQKVSLEKEVNFLKNYVEVQSVRYSDQINIHFDEQGIDHSSIEPLLLLPFVENAFKHGVEEEMQGGYIDIVICLQEGELMLSVKNSKPSFKKVEKENSGIGLVNSAKRLELLYPNKHTLSVKETEKNYSLLLIIAVGEKD